MVTRCLFAADLHGRADRYEKLFRCAVAQRPAALLLGGDLLPHAADEIAGADFLERIFAPGLRALAAGPTRVFAILGNDDPRAWEDEFLDLEREGLLTYLHRRRAELGRFSLYGYSCVPPSPFLLKDWERYDVSRFVDPGCVAPEEGWHSVEVDRRELAWGTIAGDLEELAGDAQLAEALFLFHSPPYRTLLDRAALDGRSVDHAPLDVHVGSIAIRRFLEARSPRLALCGHIHESARLTGAWRDLVGGTPCYSAAHDGPELALVSFDLEHPESATRDLV